MRFIENGPILPDELLEAQDEGRVVFFCGAGVSIADAGLPSFSGLADKVLQQLGAAKDSLPHRILIATQELEESYGLKGVFSADQIFGKLSRSFNTQDISRAVAEILKPETQISFSAHKTILNLAKLRSGHTRLITTNFDLLFEDASQGKIRSRTRSDLPRLEYSDDNWGIIHLHGKVKSDYSGPDSDGFVLSSANFGDAYLAQGWARNFIKDVLDRYVAVFVGYSADDPPIRYLLEGLQEGKRFKHKLYAFQSGDDDEAVAQWDDKGVESIVYNVGDGNDHSALWKTLSLWSVRSKDPMSWKKKVLRKARSGPAKLLPHERGMIAHLVNSQDGAKVFSQIDPPISSEWLCVFDRSIRLEPVEVVDNLTNENESINSYQRYHLDDDPVPSGRNERYKQAPVEVWDAFALNQKDLILANSVNLSSLKGGQAALSANLVPRLGYIAHWIGKVSNQKIAIWWAGKQDSLHPALINSVNYRIMGNDSGYVSKEVRTSWNTIFELNEYSGRNEYNAYEFKERVKSFGWSAILARKYIVNISPYLARSTSSCPIPRDGRPRFAFGSLVKVDIKYPEGLRDLKIPDIYIAQIIRGFRFNIEKAIDMELNYSYWLDLCSIEPDEEKDGHDYSRGHDLSGYVLHFISIFQELIKIDKEAARQEYKAWRVDPIFTRLRIWACGQDGFTSEIEFMEEILSLSSDDFWSFKGERDLLLCLRNNWGRISKESRILLEKKIMKGPPKPRGLSQDDHVKRSAYFKLNRFHWLKNQGCSVSFDMDVLTERLAKLDPDWTEESAHRAAESRDGFGGWIRTDTDCSSIKDLPLSKIIFAAKKNRGTDYSKLVEYDPFSGLCDDQPLRAISALSLAMKSGTFSGEHWQTFLSRDLRNEDSLRMKMFICGKIIQIPDEFFEGMLLTASRWFENSGPSLRMAYPILFASLWDKFIYSMTVNEKSASSALIREGYDDIDWTMEAINSPSGNLSELHMTDPEILNVDPNAGLPERWVKMVEQLLFLPGEAHRYAMVIFSYNLSWFFNKDPEWTSSHMLRFLDLESTDELDKEAVWAGFMRGATVPQPELYIKLKPILLNRVHEKLSERKRHAEILSGMLLAGWGSVYKDGTPYVSNSEFRTALLGANENFRDQVLWHLKEWSGDNESGWSDRVVPFLSYVWPKHKKLRTARISSRLCDIALVQKSNFSSVSKIVSQLVSKISNEHFYFPKLKNDANNIAEKYPEEMLDLLYAILPEGSEKWPYGAKDTLKEIEKYAPKLLNNPKLIDLKSRYSD